MKDSGKSEEKGDEGEIERGMKEERKRKVVGGGYIQIETEVVAFCKLNFKY